jgi:hypothetical protein
MDTVLEIGHKREVCEVSVDGQAVQEKDQDPSILVDIVWRYIDDEGSVEVKFFGEELKHRLKGHTFFFRCDNVGNKKVRRISICLD